MAVTWNWNNKLGYYLIKNEKVTYKIDLYVGNCLGVEIRNFPNNPNQYEFVGFWNNEEHLDNMLGLKKGYSNLYEEVKEIHLFSTYSKWEKIARRFVKAGIKVIIEKGDEQNESN